MAHTKKKEGRKLKRKLAIQNRINRTQDKNEKIGMTAVAEVNRCIDNFIQNLENRIAFFQKEVKKLEIKISKIQVQEEKAGERLFAAEEKLVSQKMPAAKKRLKELKLIVNKANKEGALLQRELFMTEGSLKDFMSELDRLKGLRRTVVDYNKEFNINLKEEKTLKAVNKAKSNELPVVNKTSRKNNASIPEITLYKDYANDKSSREEENIFPGV